MKNTQNVIEWFFGNIKEKHRHSFISFDIVDFYPSISENSLDQALSWASNLAIITKDEISNMLGNQYFSMMENLGQKRTTTALRWS